MIRIFESTDIDFSTNGLGSLPDAESCVVVEEINGEYELEMDYPITGRNYDLIEFRRLIFTEPNPYSRPQPFRIYAISKPINGIVTINAEHISYDMSGYPVSPFSASNVVTALNSLKTHTTVKCPFNFWTDKATEANMSLTKPYSMRSILGGIEGSILDTYRGEYEFDCFTVKFRTNRGTNRDVSIRYGKNLTDLRQEENCNNVYTAIYPYWYSDQDGLIELDEKLVTVEGSYNYVRALTVDFSSIFDYPPTQEELRSAAQIYISTHDIGVPKVSLTVSFVQLSESEEYREYSLLERVELGDIVNVEFPKLKVSATAECISTKYDSLSKRYISIELGHAKSDLSTTISEQGKAIEDTAEQTRSQFEQAILAATNQITGHSGGYVVLNPSTQPREILILDTPDLETAVHVWRWNGGGLGYSSSGYNGPFELAMTMDGEINANFITAGTMSANLIRGGTLSLGSNENESGTLQLYDDSNNLVGQMDKNGLKMYGSDGSYVLMNQEVGFAGFDKNNNKTYWIDGEQFHMRSGVAEEDITFSNKMRFIPITIQSGTTIVNDGIGLVSV